MDITVKEYEHRHLAMSVCEHKCNVGEKYVLPQAQAFDLSQYIAKDGLADIHRWSWGRSAMKKTLTTTGWQPPLDPKNKQIVVEAHIAAPAPGLVQGSNRLELPTTERCEVLQTS